jgi:hypothetical protein
MSEYHSFLVVANAKRVNCLASGGCMLYGER